MAMTGPILAKRLGLSRQYLSRAEQGTYSSLNPALRKWTANALSISVTDVDKLYVKFQKEQRRQTVERIAPHRLTSTNEPGHVTFERWRSGYWTSPTQFAVAFCIHPDSIQKYEEGIQKKMPKQLLEALLENELVDLKWSDAPEAEAADARLRA